VNTLINYDLVGGIATITLDDGKVNVMSLSMQAAIHAALDRAAQDGAVVVITGRPGVFSAGFDLSTLGAGGADAAQMVLGGFELALRILSHPYPVVMACTGHAIAMGAFLLLSGDYRIGADTGYTISANEVAIGLTMPHAATEILRQRLTPAAFNRAVTLAERFGAHDAVTTGFLDRVVPIAELMDTANSIAAAASALDQHAHAASKLRARAGTLQAIRDGIAADTELLHVQLTSRS
jgi:enoyl-CoA hydratase